MTSKQAVRSQRSIRFSAHMSASRKQKHDLGMVPGRAVRLAKLVVASGERLARHRFKNCARSHVSCAQQCQTAVLYCARASFRTVSKRAVSYMRTENDRKGWAAAGSQAVPVSGSTRATGTRDTAQPTPMRACKSSCNATLTHASSASADHIQSS